MVLLEGVFDFVNGLASELKSTVSVVVVALAIVFIVVNAIASKLSVAKIIGALVTAGILIAGVLGIDVVASMFTTELQK